MTAIYVVAVLGFISMAIYTLEYAASAGMRNDAGQSYDTVPSDY